MRKLLFTLIVAVCTSNSFAYYQAQQGRWMSRDPLQERGGNNVYAFIENNTPNRIDYLGLCKIGATKWKEKKGILTKNCRQGSTREFGDYELATLPIPFDPTMVDVPVGPAAGLLLIDGHFSTGRMSYKVDRRRKYLCECDNGKAKWKKTQTKQWKNRSVKWDPSWTRNYYTAHTWVQTGVDDLDDDPFDTYSNQMDSWRKSFERSAGESCGSKVFDQWLPKQIDLGPVPGNLSP